MFDTIVPGRELNTLNIYLDILFLLCLGAMLIYSKRLTAFWCGIAGGVLYYLVDYGIFYLLMGTRVIVTPNAFWGKPAIFLFWMSMSYGFTNFAMIWLWLDKDKRLKEWVVFIIIGWIFVAITGTLYGGAFSHISIHRGTDKYHGFMAIYLFVSYGAVCAYNIFVEDKSKRVNILWLLAIGILVQLGWEFALLIGGIRQGGIETLIVNSLLETNMGLPSMYLIYKVISKRFNADLSRVKDGTVAAEEAAEDDKAQAVV